jgi:hypothetical protein
VPDKTENLCIALIIIAVIENCFKTWYQQYIEHPWISLQINLQGRQMHMKLLNGKANGLRKKGHQRVSGFKTLKAARLTVPG